jgi:hypothetical protein
VPLDWPNPTAPRSTEGRSVFAPLRLLLLGQDQFFGAPGQPPSYDWPNPRGPLPARPSLTVPLQLTLLLPTAAPFLPLDWPNPRTAREAADLRSWLQRMPQLLFGQDKFFGGAGQPPANMDWPVPRGAPFPAEDRGFSWPFQLTLHVIPVKAPVALDWPNPRGPRYPDANRGFLVPLQPWYFTPLPAATIAAFRPAPVLAPPSTAGVPPAFAAWALRLVDVVNNTLSGKINVTLTITLAANAASTTVTDARISADCVLVFMPLTADAAAELAGGTLYVTSQQNKQATIAHANNSETDRSFRILIIG